MDTILVRLFELQDKEYAAFQAKLTPSVAPDLFIGVRVPQLRTLAKELVKSGECDAFLTELPHHYYDENLLHSVLLAGRKPFDRCLAEVEAFLPYIDNWAVCDTLHPKVFEKNKVVLLPKAIEWTKSPETYICRFGINMLMTYYLDKDFTPDLPEIVAAVSSEEYYVNMMIAWYFATALAKQWDAVIPFIEKKKLGKWTHNKTIQKARESYRIAPEQKENLKSLKMS